MDIITDAMLDAEKIALEKDEIRYRECIGTKLLKDRVTPQEIRDGLILFWHVYGSCRKIELEIFNPAPLVRRKKVAKKI